jgi:hypothetical protein
MLFRCSFRGRYPVTGLHATVSVLLVCRLRSSKVLFILLFLSFVVEIGHCPGPSVPRYVAEAGMLSQHTDCLRAG